MDSTHVGPEHRRADDVRLRLHQVVVGTGSTVDLEARERDAGVGAHRVQHVVGLVGQRVERGADDVRPVTAARQADDRAARILIPIGGAKARERRDDVAAVRVRDLLRDRLGLRRVRDQLHLVAQPLDSRAGDEDRAFERVGHLLAEAPGDRW